MPGAPQRLPPGGPVTLPDRGDTWVWDVPGPPGAATVILLHGWMSTAALSWCGSFGTLSQSFRVVAPDHRGHGRGLRSRRSFRLEDCADDVAALAEVLALPSAIVVGYSMGGPIACQLWRGRPELVDGLVLCATAAHFGGRPELAPLVQLAGSALAGAIGLLPPTVVWQAAGQATRLCRLARGGSLARAGRPPADEDHPTPDPWVATESRTGDPAAFIQAAAALSTYDARAWVPEVDVPTAVVITTEDRTVAPERQRWLARAIPGATVYELQAGHRACVEAGPPFGTTLLQACLEVQARSAF